MPKYSRFSTNGVFFRMFRRWSGDKPGYRWIVEVFERLADNPDYGHWWTHSESDTKAQAIESIYNTKGSGK